MSNSFYDAGAAGYDQIFGFASREYVPTLLRMARLAPGQHVLDIATGTGVAAEAASKMAGSSGSVVAADISLPMLDEARKRLGRLSNVSVRVEDGQAKAAAERHHFALGDEGVLRGLFERAGFREVETARETRQFRYSSFDAFFSPLEEGVGYMGKELVTLPADVRRLVREDLRREFEGDGVSGGPIALPLEVTFGCGRK
jgi:SAM-dependent methyltransferase